MTDPFARLGAAMVRGRWIVIAIWLILIVVLGGLLAPKAPKVLKGGGYIDPSSESAKAGTILDRQFNASTTQTAAVVFRSASQTVDDPAFKSQVTDAVERLGHVERVRAVQTFYNSGNPLLVSKDRHTTFAAVTLEGDEGKIQEVIPDLRKAIEGATIEHYVTGIPAISSDLETTSENDLHRSEVFTIPVVTILLLIVFQTVVAAAMPLLIGACAVVLALAAMYVIGLNTDVSIFALNVSSMIGLGLGIDFSLIMVNRFREQLAIGRTPRDATIIMMSTAGRSITYSGVTVLLGMFVLTVLFNLVVVRSISLAVMLVAITALAAGLTLLPAVLSVLGHRVEWLRVLPRAKPRSAGEVGFWYRFSHAIMRHPWPWLAISLLLLAIIAFPAKDLRLYGTNPGILPSTVGAVKGINAINAGFGDGWVTPVQIVIKTNKDGVWKPEFLDALRQLTDAVAADQRNAQVFSLATLAHDAGVPPDQFKNLTPQAVKAVPAAQQFAPSFVNINGDNDIALITIFSKFDQLDTRHERFVLDLRGKIIPSIHQLSSYTVYVGGQSASFLDFKDAMYGRFPYLVGGVMLVTFLMLMMFFQSLFLPIKAILLNLVSILATYGALSLIFQRGWGAPLLGFTSLHRLSEFTPAILFAILFGLSTDYEVFMLSRVKEHYHESHNNEEAVATGLEQTAGIITAAGLILIGTFGSFATSSVVVIKEIGLGLAIGVLLDSTIVRVIMVPATMRLMGDWNWWMPAWLKRIVPEISEAPMPAPELTWQPAAFDAPYSGYPAPAVELPAASLDRPAAANAIVGRLRPVGGSVGAVQIVLPHRRPFRIGRVKDNELQLFDARISRHHAQIVYRPNDFVIADLGSMNGVFVNDRRIDGPTVLRDGDRIQIGNMRTVFFTFERQTAAGPAAVAQSYPAG